MSTVEVSQEKSNLNCVVSLTIFEILYKRVFYRKTERPRKTSLAYYGTIFLIIRLKIKFARQKTAHLKH